MFSIYQTPRLSVKQDLEQLKDVTFDVASLVVEQGDQLSASHVKTKRARMAVESGTRELKFVIIIYII